MPLIAKHSALPFTLGALLLGLGSAMVVYGCGPNSRGQITLTQERVLPIPDTLLADITGGALSNDGRIAFWSSITGSAGVWNGKSYLILGKPRVQAPAWVGFSADTILVIDGSLRSLAVFSKAGAPLGEVKIRVPLLIHSVARAGADWLVAGEDVARDYAVYRVQRNGNSERVLTFNRNSAPSPNKILLSTGSGDVIASFARLPAPSKTITTEALTVISADPPVGFTSITRRLPRDKRAKWLAMPVTRLAEGDYLQVIADLNSERRVLASITNQGIRTKEVAVPIAILDARMNDSTALVVRFVGVNKIALYRWDRR